MILYKLSDQLHIHKLADFFFPIMGCLLMIDDRCLLYHEMYVCFTYHFLPQALVLTDLMPKIQVFKTIMM